MLESSVELVGIHSHAKIPFQKRGVPEDGVQMGGRVWQEAKHDMTKKNDAEPEPRTWHTAHISLAV
jgi:hypothetical protein